MPDMRAAYGMALLEIGQNNTNVVVLGADTTDSLKTAGFGREFPDRLFNVGIAEGNMVSMAAGLAYSGKIPFASTYAIFLPGRAVDQIRNNIAYPSRDDRRGLNVKLVASHGGLSVGPDGGSHQQLEDIAIMRAIPNFTVLVPADAASVYTLTHAMVKQYGPFYMRMARSKTAIIYDEYIIPHMQPGKAITLRDGSDCTIAACGITVAMALEAADILHREGISCRVLDTFSIKPIDNTALEKAARDTGIILTCEEHNILGGMGSAVAESVSSSYPVMVRRLGVDDTFGESARDTQVSDLLAQHGLSSINITKHVRQLVR
ncbi:MAG: transketolase family protein [Cenarchaeum sp. SB0661_bin_35]|nr:transketolase family protein [Cenarchaeum sp. SB0667_bin_13]MYC79567.1 transketolase family protein [Cenarchaeum sp. SB0661_bin_35]MYD58226.1 transketolase family protein [Cenarchaeum sp. SB0678_bin_8]MYI51651.1 transketolase family protein [Cenarchaeum sp. SB0673_bin_9]